MAKTFDVERLAKDLGIQPASVRIGLRKNKVKKDENGAYSWKSQTEYDKVKKLWDTEKAAPKAKKAKVPVKKAA